MATAGRWRSCWPPTSSMRTTWSAISRRDKTALTAFLETWDHALCLNTTDPHFEFYRKTYGDRIIPFEGTDPTSEVMARAVFEELKRRLAEMAGTPGAPARCPPACGSSACA